MLRTGNIDEARIGVSGWSYGGYMTSWLMTHYHVWKNAFSGAAVNDLVDEYDLSDGNVQTAFSFKGSPHVGSNMADYRAQSPISYALDVTCPVTIMSDIGDARVPVTQSFRMVTLDAWMVMEPEMFLPSTTAPSVVTVMEPDGARLGQLAPVLVASGKPHE